MRTDALATNMIVGSIGHGGIVADQTTARALCFADNCIAPAALAKWQNPDGTQSELPAAFTILPNGFEPKAKVVFLAACGIDDNFVNQWHLQPGQALIVPEYLVPSEQMHIDPAKASAEWLNMLEVLDTGGNVDAAVKEGNNVAAIQGAAHRWKVANQGGGSVNFKAKAASH